MPSPFAAVAAAAAKTHDRVMGDTFEYRPMAQSNDRNAPPIVDPARAIVAGLRLPFAEPPARIDGGQKATVSAERPGHITARPFVLLQAALLPYRPRKGDRLYHHAFSALYQVAEVVPSSVPGFIRLDLNRIKA